ncbi:hypothetical protein, partial [Clostridium estertheticum]|uniref:hypothetical protein n=1 Tax=Clostridium estertheticum TaxID=238834 RepID=UPI001C7D72E3
PAILNKLELLPTPPFRVLKDIIFNVIPPNNNILINILELILIFIVIYILTILLYFIIVNTFLI